jgi:hypothetical protein
MKNFEYYLEAIKLSSASPQTLKEIDEIKNKISSLLNILRIGNKYYNDENYDRDDYSFDPKELEEFIKDVKSKISLINKELSEKIEEETGKIKTYQYKKQRGIKLPGTKKFTSAADKEKFKSFYLERAKIGRLYGDVFRDFNNYINKPNPNNIGFEYTPDSIKEAANELLKNKDVQLSILKDSEGSSDEQKWKFFIDSYLDNNKLTAILLDKEVLYPTKK